MKNSVKQLDTFLRKQPKLGKGVYLARTAVVLGDVTIGAHSSVWYGAVLRGDINRIVVGHHSNIQDNAVLHLADDFGCIVGNWVTVGHSAIVHACTVGDEVLVGMGAVILDGAVIGKQSLIGARALVTQGMKIPPGSLVLGAPAKVVRKLIKGRTRRTEMVGAKIRGQRRVLPEAQNQCRRADACLTFSDLSYIMYDMNVITRDFVKRFSHFKRQAMAGSPVKLVDRNGRRFVFKMENKTRPFGRWKKLVHGNSAFARTGG